MLQVAQRQFLRGFNIFSPASGLVLGLEDDGSGASLAWKPAEGEVRTVLRVVHQSVMVASDSELLATPAHVLEARNPLLALLLATADVLVRDFCLQPRAGRVLVHEGHRCNVFLSCDEAQSGNAAWDFSLRLAATIPAILQGQGTEAAQALTPLYLQARQAIRGASLNQSTLGIAREAMRRGIPGYRLAPQGQFLQLGQGRHGQRIMETATDTMGIVGKTLCGDKLTTSRLVQSLGLPTAQTRDVKDADEAVAAARDIGYPVVIKPRNASKGKGVSVNLRSEAEVRRAVDIALAEKAGLIIERFIPGRDHRLLVVGGKLVAAALREPAHVVGDGRLTVRQLVQLTNRDPRRGLGFERVMERIRIDEEAMQQLARAGLTPDSVPAQGVPVPLRGTANMSRGGSSVDVTDDMHPDNRRLAERVAGLIGVPVCGIDFMTPDITRSWRTVACAVLEVNNTPGLRPHQASNAGRDVFGPIVDHLFPPGSPGRIPTVGITGSVGKTSTSRLVGAILEGAGLTVGLTTTQGKWVGGECIARGDSAGGTSAASVLLDPSVDAGVFEFARGGLTKRGLGLDALDVGAVLNLHDNHIGADMIESREDLARVKRLVVEAARECAVLNADDAACLAMRGHARAKRLALVSMRAGHPQLEALRADGGIAAWFDEAGATLELFDGPRRVGSAALADVPATWDGRFPPAIMHALFAMAITHALGVPFDVIGKALRTFEPTDSSNPGRMNLYRGLPHSVLVAYADGPHPMAQLASFVRAMPAEGRKTLMLCAAGNRPDGFILSIAHAAAGSFDRYVCTDWDDLRGRPPGEAAALLARGLREKGVPGEHIAAARDMDHAVELAYGAARAGDLIVDNSYSDAGRDAWLRARGL